MAQVHISGKGLFKVEIYESERGWGQKLDATVLFDNEKEAKEYVATYNSKNISNSVPDWYMFASYAGKVA